MREQCQFAMRFIVKAKTMSVQFVDIRHGLSLTKCSTSGASDLYRSQVLFKIAIIRW